MAGDLNVYWSGIRGAYRDHCISTLGYEIPAVETAAELIELAKKAGASALEAQYSFHTEPPFPGVAEEPEPMPSGWRMICACRIYEGSEEYGVIFTTFVSGRPTTVVVNPPGTVIPETYKPLASR
jgi:hypothetical protein